MAEEFCLEDFRPPRFPNWALIAPAGQEIAGACASAPAFSARTDQLRQAVIAAARADQRVELLSETGRQLEFRARSPVFGFPDFVTVRLVGLPDGRASLAIYSRARYGVTDLGVNRRRAQRWLRRIETQLPAG